MTVIFIVACLVWFVCKKYLSWCGLQQRKLPPSSLRVEWKGHENILYSSICAFCCSLSLNALFPEAQFCLIHKAFRHWDLELWVYSLAEWQIDRFMSFKRKTGIMVVGYICWSCIYLYSILLLNLMWMWFSSNTTDAIVIFVVSTLNIHLALFSWKTYDLKKDLIFFCLS